MIAPDGLPTAWGGFALYLCILALCLVVTVIAAFADARGGRE